MQRNLDKKDKRRIKEKKENTGIKLYSLRGEFLGLLMPGGKVDFNALSNRDNYKKTYI